MCFPKWWITFFLHGIPGSSPDRDKPPPKASSARGETALRLPPGLVYLPCPKGPFAPSWDAGLPWRTLKPQLRVLPGMGSGPAQIRQQVGHL